MARSKSSGKSKSPSKSGFGGDFRFVNVRLSSDDKARLAETDLTVEFPLSRILDIVAEGYKFSLKEDSKNSTYVASLTDGREQSVTFKTILTGRGSTALNAWYSLAYKHFVLLDVDWSTELSETGDNDFD